MSGAITIDGMQPSDHEAVRAIYQEGLSSGIAAFMQTAPDWARWDTAHLDVGRLVARDGGNIVGWVALSRVADS